jgi:hypothetical protein
LEEERSVSLKQKDPEIVEATKQCTGCKREILASLIFYTRVTVSGEQLHWCEKCWKHLKRVLSGDRKSHKEKNTFDEGFLEKLGLRLE